MDEHNLTGIVRSVGKALLVCIPILIVTLSLHPGPTQFFSIVALLFLAPVFFLDTFRALLLILILRPMLDVVSEHVVFTIWDIPLNLSSIVSILVILWGVRCIARSRMLVWRQPLFWPFVLLVVMGVVSLIPSQNPDVTIREIVRLASMAILFFAALGIFHTQKSLRPLHIALALSLVVPVAVGLVQFVTKTGLDVGGVANRISGTFGHPNVLGFYCVLIIGFFCSTLPRKDIIRPLVLMGLGVAGLCLLLTFTRGAWLGLTLVVATLGLFRKPLTVFIGAAAVILLFVGYPFLQRVTLNSLNIDLDRVPVVARVLDRNAEDSSLDWRAAIWKDMRRKALEQPLIGHGLGTFPVLRQFQVSGYEVGTEAHNDYLRLAVETGFLGLGAYLFLLAWLLISTFKAAWRTRMNRQSNAAIGMFGLAVAVACMSYFDNLLQATAVMWTFWVILAAVMVFGRQQKDAPGNSTPKTAK